jgi:hypothetical protein
MYGEECEPSAGAESLCGNSGLGSGTITCGNNCRWDYSACSLPYQCGSGNLDHPNKICDSSTYRFTSCIDFWNHVGDGQRTSGSESSSSLSCNGSCQIETSNCQVSPCGNGDIDIVSKDGTIYYTEACDPGNAFAAENLGGLTCNDFGKVGTLTCNTSGNVNACEFNLSGCSAPAASCSNGVQDGTESATDCGGDDCLPCNNGATCEGNADCMSGYCEDANAGQVCAASTFSNNNTDGKETDEDCGGPDATGDAQRCLVGAACLVDSDCSECEGSGCTSTYSPATNHQKAVLCKAQRCVLAQGVSGCSTGNNGVDNCFVPGTCTCGICGGGGCQ